MRKSLLPGKPFHKAVQCIPCICGCIPVLFQKTCNTGFVQLFLQFFLTIYIYKCSSSMITQNQKLNSLWIHQAIPLFDLFSQFLVIFCHCIKQIGRLYRRQRRGTMFNQISFYVFRQNESSFLYSFNDR